MKKIALILCICMLLPTMCLSISADTAPTYSFAINAVNTAVAEGQALILTGGYLDSLSALGATADWCKVAIFDWSEEGGAYVLISLDTRVGTDMTKTAEIPVTGFALVTNLGNDYPALGTTWLPNYTNSTSNYAFNNIGNVPVGTKVYLTGIDLANGTFKYSGDIGAYYDTDAFKTDAYITVSDEKPEGAYDPNSPVVIPRMFSFPINAINQAVAEGQALIVTGKYADSLTALGSNYDWCKVAIFDWSSEDGAYILVSADTQIGNGMSKKAVIPPHGFALITNLGNDYPSIGNSSLPNYTNSTSNYAYGNIGAVPLGSKVYLTGIDLANGTIEYSGNINKYYDTSAFQTNAYITVAEQKPTGAYQPNTSVMLPSPEFIGASRQYITGSDVTIKWAPVSGATSYSVYVYESIINTYGKTIKSQTTSSTEITIPASSLTLGGQYAISVTATDGTRYSTTGVHNFLSASERSLEGKFEGKTVVAFGDSITHWKGWVDMIECELGVKVINSGIGGDSTVNALARIQKDVISKNPDLVYVNFGMNDQFYNSSTGTNAVPIEQYEANYRTIIEKILATGSKIILVAVHDIYAAGTDYSQPTSVDTYNAVVKRLAEEYGLGLLDINAKAQDLLSTMTVDGIHLNESGQKNYLKWISDYTYEYIDTLTDWDGTGEITPVKLGDITADGATNALDYLLLKRFVLGTFDLSDEQRLASDIDGDENIDASDYTLLKRAVLGTYTIAN